MNVSKLKAVYVATPISVGLILRWVKAEGI